MFDPQARQRVYYHHLKKCGGTAMNQWLDSQFPAYPDNFKDIQTGAFSKHGGPGNGFQIERLKMISFAQDVFAARDVMHDHAGVADYVPEGAFRFTVLRDPETRLISQIRDYRRLSKTDWPHYAPEVQKMLADSASLSVADFLESYGHYQRPHGTFFDNYMVRVLAHNRVGSLAYQHENAADLVPNALDALRMSFDLVGLLEEADETNRIIASVLGWAPQSRAPHLNLAEENTGEGQPLDDARTRALIERCTRHDQLVYEEGKTLFAQARQDHSRYDRESFERDHLATRLALLTPAPDATGDGAVYGIDQPVVGAGNNGRNRTPGGALELVTRHKDPFVLYIPVPASREVDLVLGFDAEGYFPRAKVRQDLFSVDGVQVAPHISSQKREITLRVKTSDRGWARLVYARPDGADNTKKPVFGIVSYGWRAANDKPGLIRRLMS